MNQHPTVAQKGHGNFNLTHGNFRKKSGQSDAGNSNASGTGSVRVSAQGLVSILQ